MRLRRRFIKIHFLMIPMLIIGLGTSVIASAEGDIKSTLLSNLTVLKKRIKELEKTVRQERLGELEERVSQIKDELDKMIGNKSIGQVEQERDEAAGEAKGKRIQKIEEKLEEKAYKEKGRASQP